MGASADGIRDSKSHRWYRRSNAQQDFPFYEEVPAEAPTTPEEVLNAPKTVELMDEVIENCTNYHEVANVLGQNGFSWTTVAFPQDTVITVDINNETHVIDDFDMPESKNGSEWVNDMWEHELYHYLPPSKDEDFWKEVGKGFTVYHATTDENIKSIMQEGIQPKDETRGISNRGTGSAVFTSDNPEDINSYGDNVIEINVGQMKDDGYMPNVSRETPVEESQIRSALAHKIGITNYEPYQDYSSEGIYDTTIIFYGPIPLKYLTVT